MGLPRLSQTKNKVKEINMRDWLRGKIKKSDLSLRKLSLMMGMSDTYLQQKIKTGDFKGAELVMLGNYLDTNPFEPYLQLLNSLARTTATERLQAQRIAELELQITILTQERDWLKEVVMKR